MSSIAFIGNGNFESHYINSSDVLKSGASVAHFEEAPPLPSLEELAELKDQQLVSLAQSGNTDAFDELIRRHHTECMKRAMHVMHNRSDAKDEVQNAYCKALTSIGQFRGDGTFGAWLSRIVENQCFMTFRRSQVRFLKLDDQSETNVQVELVSQDMSPEDRVGSEQVVHVMQSEIRKLPPIMRDILVLYDLAGLSVAQVASQLKISIPAAKSRLSRARVELRSRLAKHIGRKGPASLTQRSFFSQTAYRTGGA